MSAVGSSRSAADPVAALRDGVDALERAYSARPPRPLVRGATLRPARRRALAALCGSCGPAAGDRARSRSAGTDGAGSCRPPTSTSCCCTTASRPTSSSGSRRRCSIRCGTPACRVGHAVRTPAEAVAIAGERLDALTAMLDARVLAGDGRLATQMLEAVGRIPRRSTRARSRARSATPPSARRERFGSTAHLLEPDLKEGAGGLRDVASIAVARGVGRRLSRGRGPAARARAGGDRRRRGVPRQGPERVAPRDRQADRSARARPSARRRADDGLQRRTRPRRDRRLDAGGLRARRARSTTSSGSSSTGCAPQAVTPVRRRRRRPRRDPRGARRGRGARRAPSAALLDAIDAVPSSAPSRGRRRIRASVRSASCEPEREACARSRRSTGSGCSSGSSPRGPTCAAVRSATPTTGSRSTRT